MTRLPVVVLVGRPNVGKSTLFNRLTGTRDALVADFAGLTRDRQYGHGVIDGHRFIVVDTGGLMPNEGDPLAVLAEQQAQIAIAEADIVILLVDAQAGLLPADRDIAGALRRTGKPLALWVNKAEGMSAVQVAEFHALGLGAPHAVSAQRGDGVAEGLQPLLASAPAEDETEDAGTADCIRVAVIGRPNAGKSTLINRLVGADRLLASDTPGTTRDAIRVPFEWGGQAYEFVDTAGIRRRARTGEALEKFSIVKALQAVEAAHVVIVVVDAQAEIGSHDARLMGLVAQRGRAMVLAVNKWDGLDGHARDTVGDAVDYRLPFLAYVPHHMISALHGSGLRELMDSVVKAWRATTRELPTPELNRVLMAAVERHAPAAVLGRRIKLRYAHQAGRNPPIIMIHGNQTERLQDSYKSYLANVFREAFQLTGVPLHLQFKTGENPYMTGKRPRANDVAKGTARKRARRSPRR
ncbi:MAG: ribosome biogenesis GTPase Der [Nevskiaceae bacterium]|nr:MAG: ribosome biogenesis GTPase Der [Nevskiaceae bacterium]TBR73666.1 MAG: ribosome biogenesis GTPase Der [Nevskiaceae bacterium]